MPSKDSNVLKPTQQATFDHLRESRYFQSLSDQMLIQFLELTSIKHFSKDAVILKQGQINHNVYCLVDGSVTVKMDGQPVCVLQRKGDIFGEMSVIAGVPCTATIQVNHYAHVVDLSFQTIQEIQENTFHQLHHIFNKWFTQILVDKLKLTSEKAKKYELTNKELIKTNQLFEKQNKELFQINESMELDLQVAGETQQAILSKMKIDVPFLTSKIFFYPHSKVSGDIYYATVDQEFTFSFFLGDATGHGVPAGLITMMCVMGLQSIESATPTDEVIAQLNSLLVSCTPSDKFISGIYLKITPEGWLTMTNAGHTPLIILPSNGSKMVTLPSSGMPLGMFSETLRPYEKASYDLKSGDKLIVYTDGISEYRDPSGQFFGMERLLQFLEKHRSSDIESLLNQLLQHVVEFSEEQSPDDDVTIIGFQML